MPDYLVTDPATGQRIKMTGPAPPSEALIRLALAQVKPMASHDQLLTQKQGPEQPTNAFGQTLPLSPEQDYPSKVTQSILGLIGLGDDSSKSNQFGQLVGAAMPIIGGIKKLAVPEAVGEGLYSRLDRAIAGLPDQKLPPMKILSTAKNATSGEEIAHRGLADFLQAAGGKPVARSEVQAHLAANPINLDVKVMGGGKNAFRVTPTLNLPADAVQAFPRGQVPHFAIVNAENTPISFHQTYEAARSGLDELETMGIHGSGPAPKYSQYQVPGGTAYKETLITLPFEKKGLGEVKEGESLMEALDRAQASHPVFKSSHFEQPNILVHVRSNERTLPSGEPGLFLEEVQSDWHQQGKQRGYKSDAEARFNAIKSEIEQKYGHSIIDVRGGKVPWSHALDEDLKRMDAAYRITQDEQHGRMVVPDAPFKEQWPDLALKHQLLDAAKRPDLQWLGFTSGETQAARYDLSKQIKSMEYNSTAGVLTAYDHGTNRVINEEVKPEKLADYIGKEAAKKLLETDPHVTARGSRIHRLEGLDLQVGGEGMKYFYDQLLPKRLEKIVKPFGGTVERAPVKAAIMDQSHKTREMGYAFFDAMSGHPGARVPVGPNMTLMSREQLGQAFEEGKLSPFNFSAGVRKNVEKEGMSIPGWIVRLSPEMKQRILKEGLPLMTGLAAVAAGQQEQK